MRREKCAFSGGNFRNKDVRVCAFRLFLRVDDIFSVFRPDGIRIALILRGAGGDVLHFAHQRVVDIDLIGC